MLVELQGLTKNLGGVDVLSEIDLKLEGGQIIALLGANGAGKTTLLHVLGGLYQPSSGELLLDGEPLSRLRLDQRQRLHYLPDIPTLNPNHAPLDYITYALEAYGANDTKSVDEVVVDLLAEFDMLAVADLPSSSLSRGQRYKATLVALLAIDPEFWILDEPFTSGMDPLGLGAMRRHLQAAKQRGRLVIYSTQLVEIAKEVSDQVCVLGRSGVVAFGSPESLDATAASSEALKDLLNQLRGEAIPNVQEEL